MNIFTITRDVFSRFRMYLRQKYSKPVKNTDIVKIFILNYTFPNTLNDHKSKLQLKVEWNQCFIQHCNSEHYLFPLLPCIIATNVISCMLLISSIRRVVVLIIILSERKCIFISRKNVVFDKKPSSESIQNTEFSPLLHSLVAMRPYTWLMTSTTLGWANS